MATEPIRPSIVGRPGNARMQAGVPRFYNGMFALGEGIENFGRGAMGAMRGAISLRLRFEQAERQVEQNRDAVQAKTALNNAVTSANTRTSQEVFSVTGFGAENSARRVKDIFRETADEYVKGLSPESREGFMAQLGQYEGRTYVAAVEHEGKQLRNARLEANRTAVDNALNAYSVSDDPGALEEALLAFDDSWRVMNGRTLSAESLAAFEADVADGTWKRPGGETLRIVEGNAGAGEVSATEVQGYRERLTREAEAYEQARQQVIDQGHVRLIDQYLKDNRVQDADNYLAGVEAGNRPPMSPGALGLAQQTVNRYKQALEIDSVATAGISRISAVGGRYGNEEQDKVLTDLVSRINQEYTGENAQQGKKIVQEMHYQYELLRQQQNATRAADTVAYMTHWQNQGLTLAQQRIELEKLPDSPVRAALNGMIDRQHDAFNNNTDPVFLDAQERLLNDFKMGARSGGYQVDGINYNLHDQEQLAACIRAVGFTDRNATRAFDYVRGAGKIDVEAVGTALVKLTKQPSMYAALQAYPMAVRDLEARMGNAVIPDDKMATWIESNLADLLMTSSRIDKFGWDRSYSQRDLIEADPTKTDTYRDMPQMTELYKSMLRMRAIEQGTTYNPPEKVNSEDVMDFARESGYIYDSRDKLFRPAETLTDVSWVY